MKIQKQIYYFVLISFSILIANFIWPLINLTNNNKDIIGVYSQNNYSSLNDILRYLSFILIPVITYFFSKFFFEKITFNEFLSNFKIKKSIHRPNITIYIFLIILLIFLILEFFSLSFPLNKIDIFHDGQRLSSAFKSKIDRSLWSGSYVSVGIILETLGSKFAWNLFDNETIGSIKVLDLIYIFITKCLLLFLTLEITKYINLNYPYKIIFFLLSSLILLSFINYNLHSLDIVSFREIPIILSLIFFIKTFDSKSYINYILIGFLSVFTFLWSVDRALVLTFFILFIFFILIYNKKYKQSIVLSSSIIFFWMLFFLFFRYEFSFFVNNTLSIIKEHSYVNGIIHPIPFSEEKNSTRATKNLLAIIFSLIISLSLFFKNDEKYSNKIKIILFSVSIYCFLSYVYAVGRSDGPHIKQAFAFPGMFFVFYFLFNFISKSKIIFLNDNKVMFVIIPILLVFFYLMNIDFKKINNFKSRFDNYVSLEDSNFLSKEDNLFVNTVSKVVKKEKCIQLFSNDAALFYLLKKPSCSKFYFVFSIGSNKNQKEFIKEIMKTNFLILNGRTDNWGGALNVKYPLINKYISENYIDYRKIEGRLLKIKKN